MINSRELLAKAGILPKLRLGIKQTKGGVMPTGPHKVKILEDEIIRKPDPSTGKDIEWVRYIVEENGEKKQYDTKLKSKDGQLSYLVQRFAEIKEGDEVIMEMEKQGIKNYIKVIPVGSASSVEVDEEEDDMVSLDGSDNKGFKEWQEKQ